MKNFKANLALGLVLTTVLLGLAFEYQIRRFIHLQGAFTLSEIPLADISGRRERIDSNYQGTVIFYSDLVGCSSCLRRLANLSGLDKAYDEVGFYAVSRIREEGQVFAELMLEYDFPGAYLVDEMRILQDHLGLSTRPLLLFFDKKGDLVATIPMDVVHDNLKKTIHRYINEF